MGQFPVEPKITGEVEAKIIALSCRTPPPGRSKWTLRLLAYKAVELEYIELYEAFDPETARGLAKRIEIHYSPKHGRWLNIAEIELGAMTRQCLGRRIPSLMELGLELP